MKVENRNLGLGVMIQMLGDNSESVKTLQAALGKVMLSVALIDNGLNIGFADGTGIRFTDEGQSCCETRYMTADGDDFAHYIGAQLLGAAVKDGPSADSEYGDPHDIEFLEIQTDRGVFTLSSHNEHNGYYGGFAITVAPL